MRENTRELVQNFLIGETQKLVAMCLDPALAFFITLSHGGLRVNPSVHLNHQLMLRTVEIQNKCLYGVLSPKTHPLKLATTQGFPENALSRSAFPAKLTRTCHKFWGGMAIPMTGSWNHCKSNLRT